MPVISSHFAPRGRNTSIVQVFSYEDKRLDGALQSMRLDEEFQFTSLMQFLALMDAIMDLDTHPQRSVEPRVFSAPTSNVLNAARWERQKVQPIATFRISVLFRQNASWQGTVLWVDRDMESQFRSALELIGLIDNALTVSLEKTERQGNPG